MYRRKSRKRNGLCDAEIEGGAESGAVGARAVAHDPDLQAVIDAWSLLPLSVRVAIRALLSPFAENPRPDRRAVRQ